MYSPWGRKELDTTEQLSLYFTSFRDRKRLRNKAFLQPPLKAADMERRIKQRGENARSGVTVMGRTESILMTFL